MLGVKKCLGFKKVWGLLKKMIGARFFWNALSLQKPYRSYKSILTGTASSLSNKIVSIPCSTSLNMDQQDKVISTIKKWCKVK